MAAYVIVQIDITDADAYDEYRKQAPATIARHGGRYLARGGRMERLEGAEPLPRVVVVEFPTYEQAKAWYESAEYEPLKRRRMSASRSDAVLVEGV